MNTPKDSALTLSYLVHAEDGLFADFQASNEKNMLESIRTLNTSLTLEPTLTRYLSLLTLNKEDKHEDSVRFRRFKKEIERVELKDLASKGVSEEEIEQLEATKAKYGREKDIAIEEIQKQQKAITDELTVVKYKSHKVVTENTVYNRDKIRDTFKELYDRVSPLTLDREQVLKDFENIVEPFLTELDYSFYQPYVKSRDKYDDNEITDYIHNQSEYDEISEAIVDMERYSERYSDLLEQWKDGSVVFDTLNDFITEGNEKFDIEINIENSPLDKMSLLDEEQYIEHVDDRVYDLIKDFYGTDFDIATDEQLEDILTAFEKCTTHFKKEKFFKILEDERVVSDYNMNIHGPTFTEAKELINATVVSKVRQGICIIENNFPKESVLINLTDELSKTLDDFSKANKGFQKVDERLKKALTDESKTFSKEDERTLENLKEFLNGSQFSKVIKIGQGAFFEELKMYDKFIKEKLNIEPFKLSDKLYGNMRKVEETKDELLDILTQVELATRGVVGRGKLVPLIENARRPLSHLRRAIREESSSKTIQGKLRALESHVENLEETTRNSFWQLGGKPHRESSTYYLHKRQGK